MTLIQVLALRQAIQDVREWSGLRPHPPPCDCGFCIRYRALDDTVQAVADEIARLQGES